MTTVLTISPLDFGIDRRINYMRRVCRRWAVSGGRRQVQVKTRATLDPSAGDNPRGSIHDGAQRLDALIRATPGPTVVLGYSQGAQVAGTWLRDFARRPDAPDPAELSFLLIGNPERRFGKQPWTKNTTPDDTAYRVRDVARRHDNWADYDPTVHSRRRFRAMFGRVHTDYWRVDPFGPGTQVVRVVGNTTYVVAP